MVMFLLFRELGLCVHFFQVHKFLSVSFFVKLNSDVFFIEVSLTLVRLPFVTGECGVVHKRPVGISNLS